MKLDNHIVEFSEYLADEARNIIIPLYRQHIAVSEKADMTPVTEVDKKVEEVLRKLIENNFPEHGISGEEYGENNSSAEYVWVIDPIDGTKSFMAGRPSFGTLISLVHKGTPVLGIIDQPITKERWIGANGETKLNGRKISTRTCGSVADAFFGTTSPLMFSESDIPKIAGITKEFKYTIYGGDCYLYGQVASGLLDVVIESGLKPHDFCALVPIIENAGGKITDWGGNSLNMGSSGKVVATGDSSLHSQVLDRLAT